LTRGALGVQDDPLTRKKGPLMHPMERRAGINRRDFLMRSGGAAAGFSSLGAFLAACSNTTSSGTTTGTSGQPVGPGGLPLSRPNRPVTMPYWEKPIDSGLKPETGGTFTIYNYPDYLDPQVSKAFGKKYGVNVVVTPFQDINSGISRLAAGSVSPDVMEMTPDNVDRAVAGKLIKPLNHDYIPNLKKNVFPSLVSPFYDQESRYTVPYTMYATGILWRTDKVKKDIPSMTQPLDIYWESQPWSGKVSLLSEVRETIAMALLRRGILDINTEDPKLINRAVSDLKELYNICNIKVDDTQYSAVPADSSWLHQAWSGDLLAGYFYYPLAPKGTPWSTIQFWKPEKGKGPVQNDCWSICHTTSKPVLSHLWLNFINDNHWGYSNFVNFNGYQPCLNEIDPLDMVKKGTILPSMQDAVLTENDLGPTSLQECTLTLNGQQLWQNGYSDFTAG
jgi:spermidine/putrescine transport system substrate-binding protein